MTDRSEETYNRYRDQLERCLQSSYEQFDKAILTLSSGGLALSLAFLRELVPMEQARWLNLLISSWGCFGAAILSTLFSFLLSQKAIQKQIEVADQYYLNSDKPSLTASNRYIAWVTGFNRAAAAAFVLAVLFTLVFVYLNLPQGAES